jgi:uncharacterized protein YyaL (SSP411 family)
MGRAFLALYTVTAERDWLTRAREAGTFINTHFKGAHGYNSSVAAPGAALPPGPHVDENVALVSFATLLHAHTGDEAMREMAAHAMRYLAAPAITDSVGAYGAGILLADRQLQKDPPHLCIVGSKSNPKARELFQTALRHASPLASRIEWADPREGPLPRGDIEYPDLGEPAAFLCSAGRCYLPMYTPEELAAAIVKSGG